MAHFDTVVIGAGPGGYVAAIRAAQLGQKVLIVEKEYLGGVCSNVGCIPSKALIAVGHKYKQMNKASDMGVFIKNVHLDFAKVQQFKDAVVKRLTGGIATLIKGNKIQAVFGNAYFINETNICVETSGITENYSFDYAIIATGSAPVELPAFKYSQRVINSTGALSLKQVPKSMVVIGGGVIGVELGGAYASFGTKVTILEGSEDLFSGGFEAEMTSIVKKDLESKGVEVITKAFAREVEETTNEVVVTFEANREEKRIKAEYVLVAIGRSPNTSNIGLKNLSVNITERGLIVIDKQCRTNVQRIFAIGDVVAGPQLAHKASYEGKVAAEAIAGHPSEIDYIALPSVVFSDPELATVGYTETAARKDGIAIKTVHYPFSTNGRALIMKQSAGFVKLVVRKTDATLIGAQIVGPNASTLISELGLAIETGLTVDDIAMTIHAHLSLSEVAMEAAEKMSRQLK
ncbi:dihydrolipoyl dehydrogenase [Metasolibacillus meyeri]|uniref:Dihydrolipoyl dehydrogenase n=2 Tax=Metasolibacillus meyeri TaxID=1071052 RepID=A0AAW9NJ96_9BACL|nr:dihydrolipoyl dehydrogenase [Metasolibacillus meyeri]MEC1177157.1 dihydrolipoyl dehydrogenase [Metasolibacillus meyeri]